MLHRLSCRLVIALLAAIAPLWIQSASAHGVTLKIQHALPEDSALHTQFLVPWAEKVEQESGGRLRIHLYPAMQLGGSASQLYDQVKEGTVDIVWTAMGYSPQHSPALDVFELPFMATSRPGSSQALWEYVRLSDRAQAELDGVRLLAIHQHEAPQLHMRNKPVAALEDLRGLKIATSSPVGSRLLAALGASPMQVSDAQLSAALSSGGADGALLPWESVPAVQQSVMAHSETDPKSPWLYSPVFVFAMNSAAYKSLSDDLKKVIDANSGLETAAWLGRVFRASADNVRKQAVARGDAFNVLPAEELKRWEKAAQAVVDGWMADLGTLGLNGKPILDAAREARAEYDPPPP